MAATLAVQWKDLAWAATNHWLDARSLADLAYELAGENDAVRLAISKADDDERALAELFDDQGTNDGTSDEAVRERWMHLAVAWLYHHRELFNDPWAVIEEIWEAFGHPESLNGLIRWMPAAPGDSLGEAGMLERWRRYADLTED